MSVATPSYISAVHEEISQEQFCDLLEVSSILGSTDLGGAQAHTVLHPHQGRIVLFDTAARYLAIRL